jgi:rRNA maturation RNase YbeY
LNKKYRGIDRPTNFLSFETGDPELLGDIFISYDTVERESKALRARAGPVKAFRCQSDFFSAHAAHMAAHGVLHLLGYDHASDSDADRMEAMESAILADLGLPDPYAGDRAARNSAWPRRLLRAGLAFLCGAAASFGFAPFYLWPMTFVGIGGAYILCARRAGGNRKFSALSFLDPAFFGAGYAAASFWWVLNSIYVVPELAAQFAAWTAPGLLGIALAGAGIFGLPFILTQLSGAAGWRRPVVFALSWATVLWLREWAFTGFPWNPLSNISFFWPALANSMSLWGALGLTFVLAGLIAATAELFARRGRRMLATTAAFYLLAAAGCIAGHFNIRKTEACSGDGEGPIRVVQDAQGRNRI